VTKINQRGKRQTRVLGIDGFNVYNIKNKKAKGDSNAINDSGEKKRGSFIGEFLTKKLFSVKRKARPISSIDIIRKLNPITIQIIYNEKKDRKAIVYECLNADNCSEIVAKINFLKVRLYQVNSCCRKT
jgi:hypothetical protein